MKTEVAYVEDSGIDDRYEAHDSIKVGEVDLAEPGVNEVHVDVKACGICHSDWHVVSGDNEVEHYPCALGHEGAGVVKATGEAVEHVEPGDHVALTWMPACGKCEFCANGRQELCVRGAGMLQGPQMHGDYNMHLEDGTEVSQYAYLGCYADEVVVHKDSVVSVREDVDLSIVALTGCGAATGFGSATNRANIEPGDTVVQFGLGGLGASAVMAADYQGADRIVVVDPLESKRKMAHEFGATHTVDPEEETPEEFVASLTDGRMADCAIFTGSIALPEEVGEAYATIRNGGELVTVSSSPLDADRIDLPVRTGGLFNFTMGERTVKGSLYGGWAPNYAIPRMLEMYKEGDLALDKLVSQTYSLDEINQGYSDMLEGKNIRGVVEFS
ncbi:alcohol dehydrogenase catalytic domain-containing protein [Natrialbaceae archaeon GCM10025810]|uniref:alcohol dehydrogenase catalytic domain-containing protein n=1 Tax=Halovalidus salilacus TaxID=3075124 RepID=UPI00360BED50